MNANGQTLLGDITEIIMGQAPPGGDCNKDARGTVFVKAGEFDVRRPLVREWTTNPLKFAHTGDVLVCVVGATAGKINEAIDCAIGRSVAAVRPNASTLASPYLYHFLVTRTLRLRAKSQGLAQGVITRDMLQEIAIPLPPLPEQRRIAEVLDRAEALRAKRRAALAQLDTLTQAIFLDMFGDPASTSQRFPVCALEKAIQLRGGFAFKSADYVVEGIPLVRIGEVNRGGLARENACFLPQEYEAIYSRFVVRPGDMLMSLTGTTGKDDYGNVILLNDTFDRYFLNQRVALLEPNQNMLDRHYLLHVLQNPKIKARLTSKSRGVRQANISNGDVLELQLLLPPIELQHEFAHSAASVEKLKTTHRASLAVLDALFAALQHRAFRGEL